MNILIVEDEKALSNALAEILNNAGYITDCVYNGIDAIDYVNSGNYDLVILDVMLPGADGYTVVAEMRKANINFPVLMLTARTTIADKVTGLNAGADDYMTKPFDSEELLARVKALTRRTGAVIMDEIVFEDLTLDLSASELRCKDLSVQLSYKELKVAQILFSNPNTTITSDLLIEKVWGIESNATYNNVEAYISFLRKKFRFVKSRVSIKHLQKLGYRLDVS